MRELIMPGSNQTRLGFEIVELHPYLVHEQARRHRRKSSRRWQKKWLKKFGVKCTPKPVLPHGKAVVMPERRVIYCNLGERHLFLDRQLLLDRFNALKREAVGS